MNAGFSLGRVKIGKVVSAHPAKREVEANTFPENSRKLDSTQ
jgi:hypothetical protein